MQPVAVPSETGTDITARREKKGHKNPLPTCQASSALALESILEYSRYTQAVLPTTTCLNGNDSSLSHQSGQEKKTMNACGVRLASLASSPCFY
jgi:hypothetical protein